MIFTFKKHNKVLRTLKINSIFKKVLRENEDNFRENLIIFSFKDLFYVFNDKKLVLTMTFEHCTSDYTPGCFSSVFL